MQFAELGLIEPIVRAVAAEGYSTPTPIQQKTIPTILRGRDVLGCAQTGTGKTAAFALPILQILATTDSSGNGGGHSQPHKNHHRNNPTRHNVRALVLCPTRELATQIGQSFQTYRGSLPLRTAVIFGGVNQYSQVRALSLGVDILVATPGRLMDLMNQGHVNLQSVQIFVLDEADRMLDMGFIHDIRRIEKALPTQRQNLLFSATMPADIRKLADTILDNPVSVQVNPVSSTVTTIAQAVYHIPKKNKPALLEHLLRQPDMDRTLVFTRTKHGADKVVRSLKRAGINALAIHGNKAQNARTRALDGFKNGTLRVLVATDIASRGIDVEEITHVINFDLPNVPETYVHRIGRTARAGASGIAISFCDPDERSFLASIERLTRTRIEVLQLEHSLELNVPDTRTDRDDEPVHARTRTSRQDRSQRGSRRKFKSRNRRSDRGANSSSGESSSHRAASASGQSHPASRDRGFISRGRGRGRAASRARSSR